METKITFASTFVRGQYLRSEASSSTPVDTSDSYDELEEISGVKDQFHFSPDDLKELQDIQSCSSGVGDISDSQLEHHLIHDGMISTAQRLKDVAMFRQHIEESTGEGGVKLRIMYGYPNPETWMTEIDDIDSYNAIIALLHNMDVDPRTKNAIIHNIVMIKGNNVVFEPYALAKMFCHGMDPEVLRETPVINSALRAAVMLSQPDLLKKLVSMDDFQNQHAYSDLLIMSIEKGKREVFPILLDLMIKMGGGKLDEKTDHIVTRNLCYYCENENLKVYISRLGAPDMPPLPIGDEVEQKLRRNYHYLSVLRQPELYAARKAEVDDYFLSLLDPYMNPQCLKDWARYAPLDLWCRMVDKMISRKADGWDDHQLYHELIRQGRTDVINYMLDHLLPAHAIVPYRLAYIYNSKQSDSYLRRIPPSTLSELDTTFEATIERNKIWDFVYLLSLLPPKIDVTRIMKLVLANGNFPMYVHLRRQAKLGHVVIHDDELRDPNLPFVAVDSMNYSTRSLTPHAPSTGYSSLWFICNISSHSYLVPHIKTMGYTLLSTYPDVGLDMGMRARM